VFGGERMIRTLLLLACAGATFAKDPVKALLIDGQNNQQWQQTTPYIKKALEDSTLFQVEVLTSPPAKSADWSGFKPKFKSYGLVVSNYNGDSWPADVQKDFEAYVGDGGAFVVVHAADNPFPDWAAYNKMIGIGGWGDRTEKAGDLLYVRDGKVVRDPKPGKAGNHGNRLPFVVEVVDAKHPVTAGLPAKWMHAADELYSRLRGPGENLHVLATAFSDPANRGTGENEPMLMTIRYGKGRVFHTTLGHDVPAMKCVGFIVTLQRGA
jgi:uncharacterized protein